MDLELIFYFAVWYVGNILYSEFNHDAKHGIQVSLNADNANGYLMTIATAQLAVGVVCSILFWLFTSSYPKGITGGDVLKMVPVALCSAGAHASSVFSLGVGGKEFGQVVKAAEPIFAVLVGFLFYGKRNTSLKQLFTFIPIIFGIYVCSLILPKDVELTGNWDKLYLNTGGTILLSLMAGCVANTFAAFKGQESHHLSGDFQASIGGAMQQYNFVNLLAFILSMPLVLYKESDNLNQFYSLVVVNVDMGVIKPIVLSGFFFFLYNFAVLKSLKKVTAATSSVANTAKRVFVIGVAIATAAKVDPVQNVKIVGSLICISGVFLYSFFEEKKPTATKEKPH